MDDLSLAAWDCALNAVPKFSLAANKENVNRALENPCVSDLKGQGLFDQK